MLRFLKNFYSRGQGRRLDWGLELLFFSFAIVLFLSFLSYSQWDSSFHAQGKGISNFFGAFGSYTSGFLFSFLGWTAIFIPAFLLRIIYVEQRLRKFEFFLIFLMSLSLTTTLVSQIFFEQSFAGGLFGYSLGYSLGLIVGLVGVPFLKILFGFAFLPLSGFLFLKSFQLTFKDLGYFEQIVSRKIREIMALVKELYRQRHEPKKALQTIRKKKPKISQPEQPKKIIPVKQTKVENKFQLPPADLLQKVEKSKSDESKEAQARNGRMLEHFFDEFGVKGKIVKVSPGPVVTLYEFEPASGTKTAKVIGLANDVARSMSLDTLRIAPISGTNRIGIELPNMKRAIVYFRPMIDDQEFKELKYALPLALGSNIGGEHVYVPLEKMPHLLVAGRTGSGKSVFIRTVILSLLYRLTPEECRFILIDPKMLEFKDWEEIPHLLTPVVTDPNEAVNTLKWAVREMENRYRKMALLNVKNLEGYNKKVAEIIEKGQIVKHRIKVGIDSLTGRPQYEERPLKLEKYPYLVIIIDELADLMIVAGKEVEASIQRLAQMARASGIHLIMATQRPSVNVITGVIKANFPTRISFQVSSKIDSRTILERQGAEQLLDHGDMLYMAAGRNPVRVHAPFATEREAQA
ncbi:MAG: DNA translocase FtsK 4TM domain-containing protein, partial [Alphaproteobacteria bacterium]|nr:DNA translocase FtsK 4TM domain-containing protein [Alphaproteobacteria bacterium]